MVVTPDKEEVPTEEAKVPAEEVVVEGETESEAETVKPETEEPVSREEVVEAMNVIRDEIVEDVKSVLTEVLKDFSEDIAELQKNKNVLVREALERTPKGPQRLNEMIRRNPILGDEVKTAKETRDDTGGSTLLTKFAGGGVQDYLTDIVKTVREHKE